MTEYEKELYETFKYDAKTGKLTRIRIKNYWGYYPIKEKVSGTFSHGYRYSSFNKKLIADHRIAWFLMTKKFPDKKTDVDHINGNKSDNRWCNLRLATRGQNNMNSRSPKNNTSGRKGVHPIKDAYGRRKNREHQWFARIKVDQKIIHLGVFKNFKDAVSARKKAEKQYFGEYAL